jgi:hypothetical protein
LALAELNMGEPAASSPGQGHRGRTPGSIDCCHLGAGEGAAERLQEGSGLKKSLRTSPKSADAAVILAVFMLLKTEQWK